VERLDTCWEICGLEVREDAVRRREVVGEHYVEGMRYLVCEAEEYQCEASEHVFDHEGRVMAAV